MLPQGWKRRLTFGTNDRIAYCIDVLGRFMSKCAASVGIWPLLSKVVESSPDFRSGQISVVSPIWLCCTWRTVPFLKMELRRSMYVT